MREIYVERIVEPYVGMPLLGVGGYRQCSCIEVRYDGEVAAVLTPAVDGHFSTQLPLEENLKRISVADDLGHVLYDGELASIGDRASGSEASTLRQRVIRSLLAGEAFSPARWRGRFDRFSEKLLKARQKLRRRLSRPKPRSPHEAAISRTTFAAQPPRLQPLISILMPVYQAEPRWFRAAVDSVIAQTYDRWELCIADDASTRVDLLAEFDRLPADSRIKFVRRSANGHICHASNSAADLATGEFIALLDHDDALAPQALAEVARAYSNNPAADLFYSDEDKINAKNHRYDPQYKPDWSPELLLSYNYVNHFTVLRRRIFERVGRFRPGYEGSQDHDLLLRATECTDSIVHIPKILYHWRALPTSTASAAGVKTYVHTSGRRAVEDALRRRGVSSTLAVPAFAQKLGLPVLSLTGGHASVGVIEHDDCDAATLNRYAAEHDEEYLLFVRRGLTVRDDSCLNRLLAYAQLPGVGVVGGRVNSAAGTVVTDDGPVQAFADLPTDVISYYFYAEVSRNVAAPSQGVLLTKRSLFERLGGFDAARFNHSLYELDYSARARKLGLRCVHVGDARFDGPAAREVDPEEWNTYRHRHGTYDAYSNPHFDPPFSLSGDAGLIPSTPAHPLKALVAAHNLNSPEGAPRYLSEIVLGLQARGVIEAAVLSPLGGAGASVYQDAKIPVTLFETPHLINAQWTPRSYEAAQNTIIAELRLTRPDVVIANTLLTFPVVEAAARLGIPSIWIIHESYNDDVLARLFTPYARHRCEGAFALASRVVPASQDTAALFRRYDVQHNIRVIHNGIDPAPIDRNRRGVSRDEARRSLGLDPSKTHIISVGTVCERKGQHTLVEAAALLNRDDFVIHIVGVRDVVPYSGYVRQLVQRHGVSHRVNLVGETSDVFAWYRAADVFACTSHMETFSRAILEAEIFGLPIVSTPCHGVGEQVIWNQNALQFPFHDAAALARHLERLIDDPALRTSMAAKSRAVFDNHATLDTMLDRYQAVLQQAMGTLRVDEPAFTIQRRAA